METEDVIEEYNKELYFKEYGFLKDTINKGWIFQPLFKIDN